MSNPIIFIDSIDAVPLQDAIDVTIDNLDAAKYPIDANFGQPFAQWVSILAESLNESFTNIQQAFNVLQASSYTSAEINALFTAGNLPNGVLLYDTDLDEYVGQKSGSLVKFTTTAYP